MSAKIIDGKEIAASITDGVKDRAAGFEDRVGRAPKLDVVLVGENPASQVYVRNKGRTAQRLGIDATTHTLSEAISHADLLAIIDDLNADTSVDGILVQLPLPDHIDAAEIIERIAPQKDVDGFHPVNVGLLSIGDTEKALIPCTPAGCLHMAQTALPSLSGLHAVIVGRSNIVGKPAAQLFLQNNCTVTVAHSRTKDIEAVCRSADILVAAVGRPHFIQKEWVKPGATVIDVGINRIPAPELGDGKTRLVGDADYDALLEVAGAITPVPGGVGPMTIAMLMRNTVIAAERK
ncbi:MAG: bifunctional methylenetetrahydrofolate dehydrogenase/methenyltetrahydrofolate cyclohydrolase FolD [Pseudomonadota bacterium]